MKKMRIAQVAAPLLPVPPQTYGGTEKIVSFLTEGLVKRGHDITLYASGDSRTGAKLKSIFPKSMMIWDNPIIPFTNVGFAYDDADKFDIIHNHAGAAGIALAKHIDTPVVTTLHNSYLTPGRPDYEYYKNACYYVAISNKQMQNLGGLKFGGMVYNAIDIDKFKYRKKKEDFFLFLSNITEVKAPDIAVRVAKKAGVRLKIAGKLDDMKKGFYNKEIKPFVDGKKIQYLGMVDDKTKFDLYSKAKALIMPLRWEEPFGLVMIEAMASGTPVIAYKRGSVQELVRDGETGFVVNTPNEMIKAMKKVDQISPYECRNWVKEQFSVQRMVESYEQVYEGIVG